MKSLNSIGGVKFPSLPGGIPSASEVIYRIVTQAKEHFPQIFSGLQIPDRSPLSGKLNFAELVINFEILRAASAQSKEVATFVTDLVQKWFIFETKEGTTSLEEVFSKEVSSLPLLIEESPGLEQMPMLQITHHGRTYSSRESVLGMFAQFVESGLITTEANRALQWSLDRAADPGWTSSHIQGKKFVLLGGTAELSPLSHLLAAGADVLTTHSSIETLHRKLRSELASGTYPGRLFHIQDSVNLLISPDAFAETIIGTFAEGQKVNIGAFAYKGGEGREWRLGAAMDGIVRKVRSAALLNSVTYYLSPSVITRLSEETATLSSERFSREYTGFKKLLNLLTFGFFLKPNILRSQDTVLSSSILSYQGASYVAANLFEKIYPAEVYCEDFEASVQDPIRVSANVAPITSTGSTDVGKTRAIFSQARNLGIEIFEPGSTRTLMYLLMINDLFNSRGPCTTLFAKQIHGGVFTNPWALDSVMKLAYTAGLFRKGET